ncbi:hypothetical protein H4R34_005905, partial [Dimargaris verticillata]
DEDSETDDVFPIEKIEDIYSTRLSTGNGDSNDRTSHNQALMPDGFSSSTPVGTDTSQAPDTVGLGHSLPTKQRKKRKGLRHRLRKPRVKGKSASGLEDDELLAKEREHLKTAPLPFKRLAKLNRPELRYIIPGLICAIVDGALMPAYAMIFAKLMNVFSEIENPEKMRSDGNFYCLIFTILGIVAFFAVTGRVGLFDISGEHLTHRVRMLSYRSIVYQDAAFFDDRMNGTGILCSKLSTESERIKAFGGRVLGTVFQNMSTVVLGLTLGFSSGWQLTLVVLATIPLSAAGQVMYMKALTGFEGKTKEAYDMAAQTASETVANLKTVAALCRERMFVRMFRHSNEAPHQVAVRGVVVNSLGSAFAQSQMFLIMIIAFYYGSRLVIWGVISFEGMLQVSYSVIFIATGLSEIAQQIGDVAKAKIAALSLFRIVDRQPAIDLRNTTGHHTHAIDGHVDAHQVSFCYPTRQDIPILQQ